MNEIRLFQYFFIQNGFMVFDQVFHFRAKCPHFLFQMSWDGSELSSSFGAAQAMFSTDQTKIVVFTFQDKHEIFAGVHLR